MLHSSTDARLGVGLGHEGFVDAPLQIMRRRAARGARAPCRMCRCRAPACDVTQSRSARHGFGPDRFGMTSRTRRPHPAWRRSTRTATLPRGGGQLRIESATARILSTPRGASPVQLMLRAKRSVASSGAHHRSRFSRLFPIVAMHVRAPAGRGSAKRRAAARPAVHTRHRLTPKRLLLASRSRQTLSLLSATWRGA